MEHGIVRPLAFEATWEENGEEVWMCVHGQSGLETLLLSIDGDIPCTLPIAVSSGLAYVSLRS